jgi:hypothetical protein
MRTRFLAGLLLAAGAAVAGDAEFDRIVKAIETHYGTRQTHIPFMGVASFIVKVAHPEGATGLRLAVFEDLKSSEGRDWRERDHFMDTVATGNLRPLVRVRSHHNSEATYIFMDPAGKSTRVLIATFEHDQATVVEVKANLDKLLRSLEDPEHAGRSLTE